MARAGMRGPPYLCMRGRGRAACSARCIPAPPLPPHAPPPPSPPPSHHPLWPLHLRHRQHPAPYGVSIMGGSISCIRVTQNFGSRSSAWRLARTTPCARQRAAPAGAAAPWHHHHAAPRPLPQPRARRSCGPEVPCSQRVARARCLRPRRRPRCALMRLNPRRSGAPIGCALPSSTVTLFDHFEPQLTPGIALMPLPAPSRPRPIPLASSPPPPGHGRTGQVGPAPPP